MPTDSRTTNERLQTIEDKQDLILELLKKQSSAPQATESTASSKTWITEEETAKILNLSPRSLYDLRQLGTIRYSTASGRKIKYLRADVEKYLDDNSNLHASRKRRVVK